MRTIYRRNTREAVWRAKRLRARGEAGRCGLALEECEQLTALTCECRPFRSRQRLTAFHRERDARVALNSTHEDLEVEVRRRRESRHADESDGLTDFDP